MWRVSSWPILKPNRLYAFARAARERASSRPLQLHRRGRGPRSGGPRSPATVHPLSPVLVAHSYSPSVL